MTICFGGLMLSGGGWTVLLPYLRWLKRIIFGNWSRVEGCGLEGIKTLKLCFRKGTSLLHVYQQSLRKGRIHWAVYENNLHERILACCNILELHDYIWWMQARGVMTHKSFSTFSVLSSWFARGQKKQQIRFIFFQLVWTVLSETSMVQAWKLFTAQMNNVF